MNAKKYNAARRACRYEDTTFWDIVKVLEKFTDLEKLTGRQIGELVNAMYASNQHGQNKMVKELI